MSKTQTVSYQKEVPVLYETEVLVVGCGVSGTVAAIASAREGAQTLVIDRFGQIGGNIGPGHIGGSPSMELPPVLADGVPGIGGEIIKKVETLSGHPFLRNYFEDSQTFSYVALTMMKEENVKTLFNVYLGDVIKEGNRVKGVFVETKDGLKAILADVVIDTTGDADVAFKAGAPVDSGPDHYFHAGMYFSIGNVDVEAYKKVGEAEVGEEYFEWLKTANLRCNEYAHPLLPYIKQAHENGDFEYTWHRHYGSVGADHGVFFSTAGLAEPQIEDPRYLGKYEIVGGLVGLDFAGKGTTSGNPELMTEIENDSREYIFCLQQFLKKYVPGFEQSYLHSTSAYYNARGGRSMIARHNICAEDLQKSSQFDDMVFRGFAGLIPVHPLWTVVHNYAHEFEMPYRQFLPRDIEGLLAAGRACNVQGGKWGTPESGAFLRMRFQMFMMGHAVGTAAAMAARDDVLPSELDVARLRKKLYESGFPMGESKDRLKELGLA